MTFSAWGLWKALWPFRKEVDLALPRHSKRGLTKVRVELNRKGGSMDEGQPISYLALETGTPVASSTGSKFGTVEHVLQVPELDLFDGIVVTTKHGARFVDRDQITDITTTAVRCSLTDSEAASLPAPKGTKVLRPDLAHDEGHSLSARYGRMFGRQHWKEVD